MSGALFRAGLGPRQAVKPKVFVSYHHGGDQDFYASFSRTFDNNYDVITDHSLDREVDSDDVDYVLRRIREDFITGTSCTIVLVGAKTYERKYVDWEISATLDKQHGLIGVCLPSAPNTSGKILVPARLHDNIQSGYAVWTTWAKITGSIDACRRLIGDANATQKKLIDNTRARKKRNG